MFDEKKLFTLSKDFLNDHYQGTKKQRMRDLVEVLKFHEWKYAVQNNPVISDFEFDQLFAMLQQLEIEAPEFLDPSSPTQRVTSDLVGDFVTVQHLSPMLSLANSYNADDLNSFNDSVIKLLKLDAGTDVAYTVEPKFDGGTVVLIYENDKLIRAATRGNGQRGDEITHNVKTIRSVPLQAAFSRYGISRCELRGEAIIRKDEFAEINAERAKNGELIFANPRNAATGGLRMKDPRETARRGIQAFMFQIAYLEYDDAFEPLISHWEHLNILRDLGFKVPASGRKLCQSIDEVIQFAQQSEIEREAYPYEIDGMVVKVNNLDSHQIIGSTSHHPRWAIAYKFKAKQATTQLLTVEYQVGKIGSITPVAKLEPVQVAGVTVSSVSLHNEDFIEERDLHFGDQVLVERAGDVIPYIVKALPELREAGAKKIHFPAHCPINEDEQIPLVRIESEAAWRCPNCTCGAQDLQKIIFHVSKPAMNIDGFGKSIVERFFNLGWLQKIPEVYQLDFDKIRELEGFGERSADKLQAAIEQAKKNPIHRLLHSLTIHHLGQRGAKILAEQIDHVLDLQNWSLEDLTNLKDIGPVLAANVVEYFGRAENLADLQAMEAAGVNLHQTDEDAPRKHISEGPFLDKTILFTGSLSQLTRTEAKKLAEHHGAKVLSAVSANLNILVVGEKAGSKLTKAAQLGTVEIIEEQTFLDRINGE